MLAKVFPGIELPNAPVVIFNKSHSGSRLLAALVEAAGVFMGSNLNPSNDSLDVLELVRYLVINYYPDYSVLWNLEMKDEFLEDLIGATFAGHLRDYPQQSNAMWGWKLCETTYTLPVIDYLLPQARYIHLIRDGRDVAFSDHRAPHDVFWRKVYFNAGAIKEWRGLRMNKRSYRRRSHIYNAIHWQNSVTVGRFYGAMLRGRYLEVRYEDLCSDFDGEARRILDSLDLQVSLSRLEAISQTVRTDSIGKYRRQPNRKVREVVDLIKPTLMSLGYVQ